MVIFHHFVKVNYGIGGAQGGFKEKLKSRAGKINELERKVSFIYRTEGKTNSITVFLHNRKR